MQEKDRKLCPKERGSCLCPSALARALDLRAVGARRDGTGRCEHKPSSVLCGHVSWSLRQQGRKWVGEGDSLPLPGCPSTHLGHFRKPGNPSL